MTKEQIVKLAVENDLVEDVYGILHFIIMAELSNLRSNLTETKAESEDKPKGRWIDIGNEGLVFKCSLCGTKNTIESHYCPNCGAKMAENEEGKE